MSLFTGSPHDDDTAEILPTTARQRAAIHKDGLMFTKHVMLRVRQHFIVRDELKDNWPPTCKMLPPLKCSHHFLQTLRSKKTKTLSFCGHIVSLCGKCVSVIRLNLFVVDFLSRCVCFGQMVVTFYLFVEALCLFVVLLHLCFSFVSFWSHLCLWCLLVFLTVLLHLCGYVCLFIILLCLCVVVLVSCGHDYWISLSLLGLFCN